MPTKIRRAPCRRNGGEASVPRAGKFGDLTTADHKVLNEADESRNDHRYAVVWQNFATQWIQSYPCKTKTSQETEKSLRRFLEPSQKPKVIWRWQFIGIWKILWTSEKYTRRLNAKEVWISHKDGEFIFPVTDGSAKLSGRDHEFQDPTLRRESTIRRQNLSGESHGDREEFQPEESKDDAEIHKTGPFKVISSIVITMNLEFTSVCRKFFEHFLFHWNILMWPDLRTVIWTSCKRSVMTIIGISIWTETCQTHGKVSQSLHYWKKNIPMDMCGPGRD